MATKRKRRAKAKPRPITDEDIDETIAMVMLARLGGKAIRESIKDYILDADMKSPDFGAGLERFIWRQVNESIVRVAQYQMPGWTPGPGWSELH